VTDPELPRSRREARAAEEAPAAKRDAQPKAERPKAESFSGGIAALLARPLWRAAALGVAFLVLATGALFAGAAVGSGVGPGDPGPSSSANAGRVIPAEVPEASRLRTCSIAALAADPALGGFSGAVRNVSTGEMLFDRAAAGAVPQGSAIKVLTAAAALNILGPDYQMPTRVYEGSTAGTIVLVGGGDPTISQLPAGTESVYAGAPKLDDLANQVNKAYKGTITKIVLDATMWSTGDKWDASWSRSQQTGGHLSEVTALQVDGDRADPTQAVSPRSTDPVARAGALFAESLGLDPEDVTFSPGTAVTTKPLLGEVKSQPVKVLVNQMLVSNDDTLAETLARVTSKSMGLSGTAVSLQQAIPSALALYEVDTSGLQIHDGSGVSTASAVSPEFMSEFMAAVGQGANNLNIVYDSLAVAGKSGTLAKRFTGGNAIAKGAVFAKTGALDGEQNMVGVISAADGTQLAFAFYAIGPGVKDKAKGALDSLATGAFTCGDNLSNN
jgi:D-alanyl-D-alanine carboxypeptidase/D-alanyl-D-alanine-endopeptidase (penicillin-binding protein 4)